MSDFSAPQGWPDGVRDPRFPDWREQATRWMRTIAPADWLARPVYADPRLLARELRYLVAAHIQGLRDSWSRVRIETAEFFEPQTVELLLAMHVDAAAALEKQLQAVQVVEDALLGIRRIPPGLPPVRKRSGGW